MPRDTYIARRTAWLQWTAVKAAAISLFRQKLTSLSLISAAALMSLAANAEDRNTPAPSAAYTLPAASANESFWQDFSASLNGYGLSDASQTHADIKIDTSAYGYKIIFPDSDPGNSVTIPSERSPWFLTANRFGYDSGSWQLYAFGSGYQLGTGIDIKISDHWSLTFGGGGVSAPDAGAASSSKKGPGTGSGSGFIGSFFQAGLRYHPGGNEPLE